MPPFWMYCPEALDREHIIDVTTVPPCQKSSPGAQMPPFPLLLGEHPVLLSQTMEGQAMVTNFRFCVAERRAFLSVPLMSVGELVLVEANRWMRLGCKDGSTYCCTFATMEDGRVCYNTLREKVGVPRKMKDLFTFRFHAAALQREAAGGSCSQAESDQMALCKPVSQSFAYSFGKEVERLGFDTNRRRVWRMSHANDTYEFCPTYPKLHLLPVTVSDDKLKDSLDFRALKRFPSVVWRDKSSGMVLIRSSQPLSSFLGVSYFSNDADLLLLDEIVKACNRDWEFIQSERQPRMAPPPVEADENPGCCQGQGDGSARPEEDGAQGGLVGQGGGASTGHEASNGTDQHDSSNPRMLAIVDCRSTAGVWGNSFKGGGTEDEVVYKCKLIHLDLANIHAIRDSFNKLRTLCHNYPEGTYFKNLSGSMWLSYISQLLRGANIVVELMKGKRRPVLVHCSDGWDRTSQICSLSELLMDPYYRTIEGFQTLVEREWLHFGHKFGERGGHDPKCSDYNQQSPIFLQFLDCVHQLTRQHPAEFEFNEAYLIKLLKHSQACLFGTFLHNCQRERDACRFTYGSVWALLQPGNTRFLNLLYKPKQEVLVAKFSEHEVELWKSVYMEGHTSQTDIFLEPLLAADGEEGRDNNPAAEPMPRTRSMEELSRANADNTRRNSDPSVNPGQDSGAAADPHNTSSSSVEVLQHHVEDKTGSGSLPGDGSAGRVVDSAPASNGSATGLNGSSSSPAAVLAVSNPGASDQADVSVAQNNSVDSGLSVNTPLSLSSSSRNLLQDNAGGLTTGQSGGEDGAGVGGGSVVASLPVDNIPEGDEFLSCEQIPCEGEDAEGLSVRESAGGGGAEDGKKDSAISSGRELLSGAVAPGSPQKMRMSDSSSHISLLSERLAEVDETGGSVGNGQHLVSGHHQHSQDDSEALKSHDDNAAPSQTDGGDDAGDVVVQHSTSENSMTENGRKVESTHPSAGSSSSSTLAPSSVPSPATVRVYQQTSASPIPGRKVSSGTSSSTRKLSFSVISAEAPEQSPSSSSTSFASTVVGSKQLDVCTNTDKFVTSSPPPLSSSSSTTFTLSSSTSQIKKDSNHHLSDTHVVVDGSPSGGKTLLSRRARAASGASRDLSVSPSAGSGNWTDTGRLRHPSGSDSALRRCIRSTVSTSTTDISDSCVGQILVPSLERQTSIKQRMDVDGLALTCDPRQELLAQLLHSKEQRIVELEQLLARASEMIRRGRHLQQSPQPTGMEDLLMSDSEGGEPSSLGATSNPSLDSWEPLDEAEAKVVPWVPDHIVTHCAGCDALFWMGRWKHHCRNCGKVFCDECSNYRAPVPHAHLNKPERVCHRCHSTLLQLSPGASSDGRIPTLVADG